MNPKKLIILGVILFLIFLIVYLFFSLSESPPPQPVKPPMTPAPAFKQVTPDVKEWGDRIKISNIEVNNFYTDAQSISSDGVVSIFNNGQYQISYIGRGGFFQISVVHFPFDRVREEAENEFVKILGISKEEACLLPVNLTTPQYANPEYAGEIFPLSFCPG